MASDDHGISVQHDAYARPPTANAPQLEARTQHVRQESDMTLTGESDIEKDLEGGSGPSSTATATPPPSRLPLLASWKRRMSTSLRSRSVDVVDESAMDEDARRFHSVLTRIADRRPRLGRVLFWLRGPSPPINETAIRPFLPKIEEFFDRHLRPIQRRRRIITPIFLLAWLLGFIFFVRASWFTSSTNEGAPEWIDGTSTYWSRDDQCGLNGTSCEPFSGISFIFRCPSQTLDVELLNDRVVGDQKLIFQPLVVGGMDDLATYRSDSWVCAAAIHHGLFGNRKGGCGEVELVGEFTGYVGGERNGVKSVDFPSTFPSSFRFVEGVSQGGCQDLRDDILGFNVAMTTIFSFFIRPAPQAFFWVLLCFGYWHVVLASDPSAIPPDIATGFARFLPTLFVGESFWRHSWRWVVPAFETAILERTIWYLGGFWVGLLINVSLSWLPIDRLTASDIQKQPGGLVAVICLVIFVFLCVLNQLRVIRRTGWFFFYLKWYAVGGAVIGVLSALPGLEFRLHHYIAAILLMPGCAFVTRPSALFQGFLFGMFLDGVGRWGFDSILQTAAELVGDGQRGTGSPTFITNATSFITNRTAIYWNEIPADKTSDWSEFALIVDDVLRYTGTATNWSISGLNAGLPHFFRLAYRQDGSSGDFTDPVKAFIANGSWTSP